MSDELDPRTMTHEEFMAWFWDEHMPAYVAIQSRALATQHLLVEVLSDLIRGREDRSGYVRKLYDRAAGKFDQKAEEIAGDEKLKEAIHATLRMVEARI